MEESYDHKTNTIAVADGDSSGDNASFGSINKYDESESEEEAKPQLKIKRTVSQYVKHITEKKDATSPLNSSIESKSPTADDTDRKIMLALSRYQSHLSQLKEIKPVEVPPPRAPTPPPPLPPTPPPKRPVLPADSPAVSVNIGIGSIDFTEAPPLLYPTESKSATHIPAELNETASTLLMTAALNALTQARGAQNTSAANDPLTTALAAASAQILAAALNKPPAVPLPPPRAPTPPPPPTPPKVMATVATETDTPPPSPRVPKGFHDHLRRNGGQLDAQAFSAPNQANANNNNSHTSAYDRMMASRGGAQAQGSYKGTGQAQAQPLTHAQAQGLKPQYFGAGPSEPPLSRGQSRRGSFGNTSNTNNPNTSSKNNNYAGQNSASQRAAPAVPPLAVAGLSGKGRPSLDGIAGSGAGSGSGSGSARRLSSGGKELAPSATGFVSADSTTNNNTDNTNTTTTTTANTSAKRDSWPHLPHINTSPQVSARSATQAPQDTTTNNNANITSAEADAQLRSSLSASLSPTTTTTTNNASLRRPSSAHSVHSATSATSSKSLKSVKSLTFAEKPEPDNNHTIFGERVFSEIPENMNDGYFGSESGASEFSEQYNTNNSSTSPSFKDFHLKYAKGLMAIEAVRSDSFSPKSAFSASPRNTTNNESGNGGTSGVHGGGGGGGGSGEGSVEISELDDTNNGGSNSARSNDDACSAISEVYSGSSEVYSGTNTYNTANHTANTTSNTHLTYSTNDTNNTTHSLSLSPTPHVDSRMMMDTLLNGTDSVQTRLRIEAEYQPPVNMYTKQFHSVDPRVFEAVYEDRSPTTTSRKKSPRALYRNSIMQLITTTPGFINSPRNKPSEEYVIDYTQYDTDYNTDDPNDTNNGNNSDNNNDSVSEYNFGEEELEEEKSEISAYDSTILSESVVSSVYTVHSIPGVADKRTGGCMIHRTVSNTGTAVAPVSKYYNLNPSTIAGNSEKGMGIAEVDVNNEEEVSEYSSVASEPIVTPNTSMYKHKHNLSMYTTTVTSTSTPPVHKQRPHSTPHLTSHATPHTLHATHAPHTPHTSNTTHRLVHTNSTRSVHRSFKYDDTNKAHILGRQTKSIKGQNKLHDSALEFKQDQCLNSIDAKNLKLASVQNRNVLVGWQVLILKKGEMSLLGLAVITGVRTNFLLQTEYRISSDVSLDCWVRLKRGKGMGGTEFQPLRKVLTTKQGSTKMRVIHYKKTL